MCVFVSVYMCACVCVCVCVMYVCVGRGHFSRSLPTQYRIGTRTFSSLSSSMSFTSTLLCPHSDSGESQMEGRYSGWGRGEDGEEESAQDV